MPTKHGFSFLLVLFSFSTFSVIEIINTSPDNKWPEVRVAKEGAKESRGFYTGGCLIGAKPLDLDSKNYQVGYPKRHRYFGHPRLIEFAEELSNVYEEHMMVFGDLSQPRGGPVRFGHSSHQTGLDVDIYYHLTKEKLENFEQTSMVSEDGLTLNDNWDPMFEKMLLEAAKKQDVERLFVNAVVKKELCRKYPKFEHLNKVRPWYFHDTHFHVRLACPKDSKECRKQNPPPKDAGCGSALQYWFHKDRLWVWRNRNDKPKSRKVYLPDSCAEVLKDE